MYQAQHSVCELVKGPSNTYQRQGILRTIDHRPKDLSMDAAAWILQKGDVVIQLVAETECFEFGPLNHDLGG